MAQPPNWLFLRLSLLSLLLPLPPMLQGDDGEDGEQHQHRRPAPELEDTGVVGEKAMGKGEVGSRYHHLHLHACCTSQLSYANRSGEGTGAAPQHTQRVACSSMSVLLKVVCVSCTHWVLQGQHMPAA